MGLCIGRNSNSLQTHNKLTPSTPATPSTNDAQFTKRENALNKILKLCQKEEQHWIKVIDNFTKYDQPTQDCLYIISFWSRQYIPSSSPLFNEETNNIDSNEHDKKNNPFESVLTYFEPKRGLFNHCKRDQFKAHKKWALARLEWVQRKHAYFQDVKDELLQYEFDWKTNKTNKKYWRCQICKHSNIKELFIEHEQDTSYEYNYKREICREDFQFAYHVKMQCKTKRISLDTGKLVPNYHSMYLLCNLRKYEVVDRFVMHRCRVCNDNHILTDSKEYRHCDHCSHPFKKHDQIWCKHADEFDGSEQIITKRFKGMDGEWME